MRSCSVKLASVVGARPQFVKVAPILRAISVRNEAGAEVTEHLLVHTGQHYDYEMSQAFFGDMNLPEPQYNLEVGSGTHGVQTAAMLERIEEVLRSELPDLVLVYGDTNSTLAGALASAKLHVPVGHVEAGLRSYRKDMPEEINRVLSDHVSTLLFCPTTRAVRNLQREGIGAALNEGKLVPPGYRGFGAKATCDSPWILNVGDVMKDALVERVMDATGIPEAVDRTGLAKGEYAVATVHRAENTDNRDRLQAILRALERVSIDLFPVVFPIHPRTRKAMERYRLSVSSPELHLTDPIAHSEMLRLLRDAQLVLTDSGGLQKEAFLLSVPCVTLRNETEWVELVDSGWNRLVDADEERICDAAATLRTECNAQDRPVLYGDGHAAERIADVCLSWWIDERI
jgi:UDP-GlcNAc3NAcA epimerase